MAGTPDKSGNDEPPEIPSPLVRDTQEPECFEKTDDMGELKF